MLIRTSVEDDLDQLVNLLGDQSVNTAHPARYTELLAAGQYRHDFTWVAEEGGRLVAAAVWWSFPGASRPFALDGLYALPDRTDSVTLWTELIRQVTSTAPAGEEPPSYHIFLPPDWRSDAAIQSALATRSAAARAAGMTQELERLRFEWLSDTPVPERSTRLTFRAEPDDQAFLDVFQRVAAGSLDANTHDAIARAGLAGYAQEDLDMYKEMPGERSWWKLAYDSAGDLVGFGIPSRNNGGPVVGFLGVVPEHRGHAYAADLLAEITADLVDLGADRIAADTDLGNVPMANTFRRLGYRQFAVRLVLS
ncbi:MAG: GNAT family N-acetyltransferase [Hamadaea sp.]|uniref:GNAT family N-acetyltransferase n=1 Tax=Hamadaea sp. TaxID=2024425 RepID=UPI001805B990|nr:GNAT family N-acetyltransferase [Hamadaea sp.]NUR72417.1 GNAT family N-acetyltransferase [Hamadaea sp.]NUT19228.1 GNAT family N-acetyltransferase [Hamadaea sp.]